MHRILGACFVLISVSASAYAQLFDIQKVTDGVYAALALPRTPINCNAAVIAYDEGVLVVDTHSRPSSAAALIAEIKKITNKPVRYAVNSHFHWDHAQGNQAYPRAFPREVTLVSSEATRQNLAARGIPSVRQQLEQAPGQIATLKQSIAAAKSAAERSKLQEDLAQAEDYVKELQTIEITLPDLTFDKSLILHRKDNDIFILFLGKGHTDGDVVVYLPKQRVVATGDLLHGWMPYMGDSYPDQWVQTLDQLGRLDFDHIIGGHGTVKPKSHLTFFRNYLADLIAETRKAVAKDETLAQAQQSVAAALRPRYEEGMAGFFAESIGANVQKVYEDLKAKKY